MRALLDTNIVYDMLCMRPFDEEGLLLLRAMLAFEDVELWVSAKSYTDLFYLMHQELDGETAQDLLEDTLSWVRVCSVEGGDIEHALAVRWRDFEDAVVYAAAEKVKADYLITRDEKGFRNARIPHGTASEFMDFVFEKTRVRYGVEDA